MSVSPMPRTASIARRLVTSRTRRTSPSACSIGGARRGPQERSTCLFPRPPISRRSLGLLPRYPAPRRGPARHLPTRAERTRRVQRCRRPPVGSPSLGVCPSVAAGPARASQARPSGGLLAVAHRRHVGWSGNMGHHPLGTAVAAVGERRTRNGTGRSHGSRSLPRRGQDACS